VTLLATSRAIERSGGHLYTFVDEKGRHGPFPGATAICGLQDSLGGSDGLMTWGVNLALDAYKATLQSTKDWEQARSAALDAKDAPRNLGSAVHVAVDRFNRGLPLDLTAQTAPYIAQYATWVHRSGIEILSSERFVVNRQIGFGGTYDLLCRIDGQVALVDAKTGKEKISQRLQLSGLSMGEWHGEAGLEAEPMPKVEMAYILLLRSDAPPQLVPHEITDDDRGHFIYLVQTYHRIREWAAAFAPTALREAA
jgi:hypothetical protein